MTKVHPHWAMASQRKRNGQEHGNGHGKHWRPETYAREAVAGGDGSSAAASAVKMAKDVDSDLDARKP